MCDTDLMLALLRRLKVETNGAVVEAMDSRGLLYPHNYGVALPSIKKVALEYAPNHSLALLLFQQQVRELILASLFVADPKQVTLENCEFWKKGISTIEIAEVAAMLLISRSPDAEKIITKWIKSSKNPVCYAAFMSAARADRSSWSNESIAFITETAKKQTCGKGMVSRGAELLLERLEM